MILELNTDDQAKELLEGRRRYREQLATSYAAGEINTAKKLNPIIEQKDAVIASQNTEIATLSDKNVSLTDKNTALSDENARLRKLLVDKGIQP